MKIISFHTLLITGAESTGETGGMENVEASFHTLLITGAESTAGEAQMFVRFFDGFSYPSDNGC